MNILPVSAYICRMPRASMGWGGRISAGNIQNPPTAIIPQIWSYNLLSLYGDIVRAKRLLEVASLGAKHRNAMIQVVAASFRELEGSRGMLHIKHTAQTHIFVAALFGLKYVERVVLVGWLSRITLVSGAPSSRHAWKVACQAAQWGAQGDVSMFYFCVNDIELSCNAL